MALLQIAIIPIGTQTASVGVYVADVQRLLKQSGLQYELQDMGTIIYGSVAELFSIAEEIHRLPFSKGAKRVVTHIFIDEHLGVDKHIGDKKNAVLNSIEERDNEK